MHTITHTFTHTLDMLRKTNPIAAGQRRWRRPRWVLVRWAAVSNNSRSTLLPSREVRLIGFSGVRASLLVRVNSSVEYERGSVVHNYSGKVFGTRETRAARTYGLIYRWVYHCTRFGMRRRGSDIFR